MGGAIAQSRGLLQQPQGLVGVGGGEPSVVQQGEQPDGGVEMPGGRRLGEPVSGDGVVAVDAVPVAVGQTEQIEGERMLGLFPAADGHGDVAGLAVAIAGEAAEQQPRQGMAALGGQRKPLAGRDQIRWGGRGAEIGGAAAVEEGLAERGAGEDEVGGEATLLRQRENGVEAGELGGRDPAAGPRGQDRQVGDAGSREIGQRVGEQGGAFAGRRG